MILRKTPAEIEAMSACDVMRLERYLAHRPAGPEHLDVLQALISSAVLAAGGARVSPADCMPAWVEGHTPEERVYRQARGLIEAMKSRKNS